MDFELTAEGLGFPEGPVVMDDGTVLFVDIKNETLCKIGPGAAATPLVKLPGGPNGAAIGPDGAVYICNNGGAYTFVRMPVNGQMLTVPNPAGPPQGYLGGSIQRVDLKTLSVSVICDHCDGKPLLSPDDLVFDKDGGIWFTATGLNSPADLRKGGVYYLPPGEGTAARPANLVADIPTANGIGLSPCGTTLYVADTLFGRLWAMDITAPGTVAPGPLPGMPGRVVITLPGYQWFDSLAVEADGRICVGTLLTGGISVVSPEDGTVEHVAVPDMFTTNLAFGGRDGRDVYITASSTGKIYRARWPREGLPLAFSA